MNENMKKYLVTLFVICLTTSAFAVDLPKQGFGMQIGWAQPTLRVNDPSTKDSLSHHLRFHGFKVGVVYDGSFAAGFGASMGLNYTFGVYNSGWESRNPAYGDYPKDRQLITYNELELFVDWQYKFEVAKETYLILYTGPTIQCGIALNTTESTRDEMFDKVESKSYDRFIRHEGAESYSDLLRLNVTWGVGAGFQYKRYFVRGGYDFGLVNPYRNRNFINPNTGVEIERYTRGRLDQWSVKVGIYLWYHE